MKKFLIIYYAPQEIRQQMAVLTPEQQRAQISAWTAWAQNCGNMLLDFGAPLLNGKLIMAGGTVFDSISEVTGYSLLQAPDGASVVEALKNHPHFQSGDQCRIEMLEMAVLPSMS
jgi:hypothetical protein